MIRLCIPALIYNKVDRINKFVLSKLVQLHSPERLEASFMSQDTLLPGFDIDKDAVSDEFTHCKYLFWFLLH